LGLISGFSQASAQMPPTGIIISGYPLCKICTPFDWSNMAGATETEISCLFTTRTKKKYVNILYFTVQISMHSNPQRGSLEQER
jgi:hypothetical protein